MNQLNIVFAGTPAFGIPCLDALLHSNHHLQAIYTQPDRPAGRGRKLQSSAVKEWALKHQIPVYQPINFKNPDAIAELNALKPDIMVVIAYGLILPKAVLDTPGLGCINVHASLLPRWRGASPIQSAILHGDQESGVTIMQMDVGLDTGAMLNKVICPITSTETASSLHDKLAQIAAQPLIDTLNQLANQTAKPEIQNNELATYASKIKKEDACINWQQTATEIDQKIRAFNPWPIAYTIFGHEILRVHQAKIIATPFAQAPGTVISIDKKGLLVATGSQGLLVEKIQLPGAKVITIADWLNSSKSQVQVGFCFDEQQ
ncbi:methionyl-tRNA formyltransferase [Legionella longbeachae]|uniref:Methionyl-tRNA formyltransferase n=1 Tax=Legionella longbeachae serogroup 1 (strain NSW150) TaxID=661367 RepID=D3HQ01_LEGLN|nr:methionyl-tRNA formyltransferase [Legionella longbeachae]VEE01485.1 methionyl-tRNA formyltransferase [Legionella oakridgensis]HBD7396203.1 methionyl-tRNA formyltransferase [Legionella pneumophila]ARB92157.1 methionyl-tRNA formyltransferase [Legionella longbeachae]ARM34663.1 methionyl-tRNA formyltransferase [Legionella longbeachae]EEZ96033.1 methionyl-tRNA formyltransferase [Legionella longbeachae D-4968]